MSKINLSKYFDKVYILTYLGSNYKTKINNIKKQWNQLFSNKFNNVEIKYSFNSKLFRDLYSYYQEKNPLLGELDNHNLNVTMWHYLILMEAYNFGYDNVLVLEDDVAFLKYIKDIKNILDNLPKDYDICQLHKGYYGCGDIYPIYNSLNIRYNDYFYKFNNKLFNSANMIHVSSACNCFSRNGMKVYIDIFENLLNLNKRPIFNIPILCDTYYSILEDNINYYVAYNDLCLCYSYDKNGTLNTDNKFTINKYKDEDYLTL